MARLEALQTRPEGPLAHLVYALGMAWRVMRSMPASMESKAISSLSIWVRSYTDRCDLGGAGGVGVTKADLALTHGLAPQPQQPPAPSVHQGGRRRRRGTRQCGRVPPSPFTPSAPREQAAHDCQDSDGWVVGGRQPRHLIGGQQVGHKLPVLRVSAQVLAGCVHPAVKAHTRLER